MFPFVRGQRNRKTCIFLQLRYIISLRIQFGPPAYNSGRLLFIFPWHYSRPVCKICVIWKMSPVDSFSLAQLGFQLIWKDSRPIPKKDCKEQFWVHVNQSLWNAGVLISVSALLVSGQAAEGEECVLLFRFLISRPSCDWVWAAGWKIRSETKGSAGVWSYWFISQGSQSFCIIQQWLNVNMHTRGMQTRTRKLSTHKYIIQNNVSRCFQVIVYGQHLLYVVYYRLIPTMLHMWPVLLVAHYKQRELCNNITFFSSS